jgi:hypothetical protein
VTIFAVTLVAKVAIAQIGAPQPIDSPVPDQWRSSFEQFLTGLGVAKQNQKDALEKTKAFRLPSVWHENSVVFRLETPATCHEDMCLTVVGRIHDGALLADAMFVAGKRFTISDHLSPSLPYQGLPMWFVGDKVTVTLIETPQGWIVAPNPTDDRCPDRNRPKC